MKKNFFNSNKNIDFDILKDRFFSVSHELFLISGFDGSIKLINDEVESILGYSTEEIIKIHYQDLIHPEDLTSANKALKNLGIGKATEGQEFRIKCKNGKYKWIYWNATVYAEQKLILSIGIDITSRKETEEELRLLESLVFAFNEIGNLKESLNITLREICRFTGWPFGEAWMLNEISNSLIKISTWHINSEAIMEFAESTKDYKGIPGEGIVGNAWTAKSPVWIEDLSQENNFKRASFIKETGLNSYLIIPILNNQEVVAALAFFQFGSNPINHWLLKLLTTITQHLASLIEHKKVEERLIEKEILLNEIEEITHSGHWEIDYRKESFFWSDGLFSIYGIQPTANINIETISNSIHPADRDKLLQILERVLKEKTSFVVEFKIIRSDGSIRDLISRGDTLRQEDGTIIKMVGITQDITAQKKINAELQKTEIYFRSLIENDFDIKTIINRNGYFKFVSPSAEFVLGYKPEELNGSKVFQYIHPEDLPLFIANIRNLLHIDYNKTILEFRFRKKDGNYCHFESIIKNLLTVPQIEGIIVNSKDISTKKNDEVTIRTLMDVSKKLNSELDVDQIIDILVTEGIKLVDAEHGVAGLRIEEGFVSKKYFKNKAPFNFEYIWQPHEGLAGKVLETKLPYITNSADSDPFSLKSIVYKFKIQTSVCLPIIDSQKEVIGFLKIDNKNDSNGFNNQDVEKLISLAQIAAIAIQNALAFQKIQTAEIQLNNSRQQLRRLSAHLQSAREEERTRIAREIHDELGQSLTGIKMDIAWFEKKYKSTETSDQLLIDKLGSMSQLIDSTINTVRKISSELRPGVLDYLGLPAAIEWQAQDFQNRTGIICKIKSLPEELKIPQNRITAIFRIFQETLTNVARHAQASEVEIRLDVNENFIVLEIKDNGRGITESEIQNTKSLGLLGMHERAELLEGEFKILGSESGTNVIVKIPSYNINNDYEEI
ncbi:MAG: PAS domain-containing protein [Ignavibacteriales bacterium]|nr:PAS domain-containing protein [Ignavibacteriales bacterium]